MPFSVTIPEVSDAELGPVLARLAETGYPNPLVQPIGLGDRGSRPQVANGGDLPVEWRKIDQLEDQFYWWPTYREHYPRYTIHEARTAREGTVRIALGEAGREQAWGRHRSYVIAFLTSGAPQIPLVEFLETDPEGSGEMLAVIRGRDGGRKMYGPADPLPHIYSDAFRTGIYRDHVDARGAWNKQAVIVADDDHRGMLNHALLQARRRGDV